MGEIEAPSWIGCVAAVMGHGTESAVLMEAEGEGIDWDCFEAACLKF